MTWSHTVGPSLSNSLLVVGVSIEKPSKSAATVLRITYDTTQPLMKGVAVSGASGKAELWFLPNPHEGMHPIVVTFTTMLSTDGAVAGAVSLSGVDQTMPVLPTLATGSGNQGDGTSPWTSIVTQNDNAWLIDVAMLNSGSAMLTKDPSQTQQWKLPTSGIQGVGSTRATSAHGLYRMRWTPSTQDGWAQVVAEIKP